MATMQKTGVRTIVWWVIRAVLALLFFATGLFKLTGQPMMIAEFDRIGFGQGFRVLTGLIEWTAAALVLWPRTAVVGAALMLCVLAGAFVAQALVLHSDVIHVVVIAALVALTIWLGRRPATTVVGEERVA